MFLVGGLGSNIYLAKYLDSNLTPFIDVKQPADGDLFNIKFANWSASLLLCVEQCSINWGWTLSKSVSSVDITASRVLRSSFRGSMKNHGNMRATTVLFTVVE